MQELGHLYFSKTDTDCHDRAVHIQIDRITAGRNGETCRCSGGIKTRFKIYPVFKQFCPVLGGCVVHDVDIFKARREHITKTDDTDFCNMGLQCRELSFRCRSGLFRMFGEHGKSDIDIIGENPHRRTAVARVFGTEIRPLDPCEEIHITGRYREVIERNIIFGKQIAN